MAGARKITGSVLAVVNSGGVHPAVRKFVNNDQAWNQCSAITYQTLVSLLFFPLSDTCLPNISFL
jgi:hypothetical protein